jgi:serine/threonine protein kinase
MLIDTTNRLVEAIRELGLVDAERFDELALLAERHPGVRDLGRQLMQLDLLTPYQVNQVLQGRGQQLLLGPYVLVERLGTGGMGEVFKARHRRLQRIAAVKVVSRARIAHANALHRFRREAEVAAHLSHPNIVAVHDFGEEGDTWYLAMEYIDGADLNRLLMECGPLPVALACEFIRQAAVGLHHAHEQGFVHRDVKPSNLLVAPRGGTARTNPADNRSQTPGTLSVSRYVGGTVKILDLGLIRLQPERDAVTELALTQHGIVIGTMDYLAPEQARNSHRVDHRADLYSLGCTLFHLLSGKPPFLGTTPLEKLLRHQSDPPPSLRAIRPDVPADLEAVIHHLLAKTPQERPQTAAEAALALAPFARQDPKTAVVRRIAPPPLPPGNAFAGLEPTRILAELPETESTRAPAASRARKRGHRTKPWRWLAVGILGVILLGGAVLLLRKPARTTKTQDPTPVAEVDRLVDYLPADTSAVLNVRAQAFLSAPVFRRGESAEPALDPGAVRLLRVLGHPAKDVDQVRFFFPSAEADRALWLVRGKFKPSHFSRSNRNLAALESNGVPTGLYCLYPTAPRPVYLGHHREYLLVSRQSQRVKAGLDHAKNPNAAYPSGEMPRLVDRADRQQHLWLAVLPKQLGPVPRLTNDVFTDAALRTLLENSSTIEAGLHCADDLRMRGTLLANDNAAAKRIVDTLYGLQWAARLGLGLTPKSEYDKRLWFRLLHEAKVERDGLSVRVESRVTPAL